MEAGLTGRLTLAARPRTSAAQAARLLGRNGLLIGCTLCCLGVLESQAEQRLLMTHAGMEAYLLELDCNARGSARLEVSTANPALFDGDRVELQRLIAQVRAVLSIECPTITRITARGSARGNLYFAGATDKRWDWRIIGLFAPPERDS